MGDFPKSHSCRKWFAVVFLFDSNLSCYMNGSPTWRTRVAARVPAVAYAQFVEMDVDNAYECLIQKLTEYLTIASGTMDASQKYQHLTSIIPYCLFVICCFF